VTIYISSDHGGFNVKRESIEYLQNSILASTIILEDLGPVELNPNDDYPYFADILAQKVVNNLLSLGILICRSGNGMVIGANKTKGAYAALCFTPYHAEMARKDDGANILCLDADYSDKSTREEIIQKFITTKFAGENTRYSRRLNQIKEIERKNFI